jgi:hypothetical protein
MGSTKTRLDAVSSRPEPTAREYHTGPQEAPILAVKQECVVREKTPEISGAAGAWAHESSAESLLSKRIGRASDEYRFEKYRGDNEKVTRRQPAT